MQVQSCLTRLLDAAMEGRVPRSVGAKHFSKLLRQADGYYPKYAASLDKIRSAAKR